MGDRKYIEGLARNAIGSLNINIQALSGNSKESLPRDLGQLFRHDVRDFLKRHKPEALGKIVACGIGTDSQNSKTRMVDVGLSPFHLHGSGEAMLRELAVVVVIASMADIIWAKLQKAEAEKEASEPTSVKGLLMKLYDEEGKPLEEGHRLFFIGLTLDKLGKKVGEVTRISDVPFTVIEAAHGIEDERYTLIDEISVKKRANQ